MTYTFLLLSSIISFSFWQDFSSQHSSHYNLIHRIICFFNFEELKCASRSLDGIESKIKPDSSRGYRQHSAPLPPTPPPVTSVCLHLTTHNLFSQTVTRPPAACPHVHSVQGIRPSANMQFHRSVLTAFMSASHNQSLSAPCASICVVKIQYSVRELSQVMKGNRGDRRGLRPCIPGQTNQCNSIL